MKQIMFLNTILNTLLFYGVFSHSIIPRTVKEADDTTEDPFSVLMEVVGNPVDESDVRFFLHTYEDCGSSIDPSKPNELAGKKSKIYILIHGFTQSRATTPWFEPLTEFLLEKYPDVYVVQTDWSKPAAEDYPHAAFSTEGVGNIIGNFINKLVNEYDVPLNNIVLIGHSLGSQVAGWVGKRYFELNHKKLPRIIALDPAGPLFSKRPDEKRLNRYDADVVIVLHTNAGTFGISRPTGTIDFFANGGSKQPGCGKGDSRKELNLEDPEVWCDHQRAYNLFLEAVKSPNSFVAKKCKNYKDFKENKCKRTKVSLGDLETTKKGLFYLDTGGTSPFY